MGSPEDIISRSICVKSCPSPSIKKIRCATKDYYTCHNKYIVDRIYQADNFDKFCWPDVEWLFGQGRTLEAYNWIKTDIHNREHTALYTRLLDFRYSYQPAIYCSIFTFFTCIYAVTLIGLIGRFAGNCVVFTFMICILVSMSMYYYQSYLIDNDIEFDFRWDEGYAVELSSVSAYYKKCANYYLMSFVAFIFLLWRFKNRLYITLKIFDFITHFFNNSKKVYLAPILLSVVQYVVMLTYCVMGFFMWGIGEMHPDTSLFFQRRTIVNNDYWWLMVLIWVAYFVIFYWTMRFVRHLNKFIVSFITAEYYFSIYEQFEAKTRLKNAY